MGQCGGDGRVSSEQRDERGEGGRRGGSEGDVAHGRPVGFLALCVQVGNREAIKKWLVAVGFVAFYYGSEDMRVVWESSNLLFLCLPFATPVQGWVFATKKRLPATKDSKIYENVSPPPTCVTQPKAEKRGTRCLS